MSASASAVQPPRRKGFGTTIIERSIPYELGGEADVRFELTGLRAEYVLPANCIQRIEHQSSAEEEQAVPETTKKESRDLGRALIVEDNLIIALDAEEMLKTLGAREIDVAMAGRDAMELEIAKRFPDAEYRDTWVWFQSGINTDGAHNPVTNKKIESGDILSLNCFPMIFGYYTALERTLFCEHASDEHLALWEKNCAVHEKGTALIKPGVRCCDIASELNEMYREWDLLQYRSFGYGHSFGVFTSWTFAFPALSFDLISLFSLDFTLVWHWRLTFPKKEFLLVFTILFLCISKRLI